MKIPTLRLQSGQQWAVVLHVLDDQMLDAVNTFQTGIDRQQTRAEQDSSLTFGHMLPCQCIHQTVIVFQCDEGDTARSLRALAQRH